MTRYPMTNRALAVACGAVLMTTAGCGPTGGDDGEAPACLEQPQSPVAAKVGCEECCSDWGCGSNTALIDGQAINPIFRGDDQTATSLYRGTSDTASGDFRLVADSFTDKNGESGTIRVENGEFVVTMAGQDTLACGDLRFGEFRIHQESTGVDWWVTIEDVGQLELFRSGANRPVTAYRLYYDNKASDGIGIRGSLCPCARTWGFDWHESTGAPIGDTCTALEPQEAGQFAVLLSGETYDRTRGEVALSGADGTEWFNIACSGSALSKMKLMSYDPEVASESTTAEQRQATLHMITARYCPEEDPATSFTADGTPLVWRNLAGWFESGVEGEIEARWSENGALCLNTPRYLDKAEVETACGKSFAPCEGEDPGGWEWTSYHPAAP